MVTGFLFDENLPLNFGELIETLILISGASFPDEFRDRIEYLSRFRRS